MRPVKATVSRHRTLVVNNSGNSSNDEDRIANGWVTKRDRHMQLINTSILDKTTQARSKAMEETRRKKATRKDQSEKDKIHRFLHTNAQSALSNTTSSLSHEILVEGLRFQVLSGGSKLARLRGTQIYRGQFLEGWAKTKSGSTDRGISTPKSALVGGVLFHRSKNGNLYRSGVVAAKRYDDVGTLLFMADEGRSAGTTRNNEPCPRFTPSGNSL